MVLLVRFRDFKLFRGGPPIIDTTVHFTKQDFVYQLEAVKMIVQCMKVKFIMGKGLVVRRCYYAWLDIFRTLISIRSNRDN